MTVVVFADGPDGGDPAPVVLDAAAPSDERMRRAAAESGHESAFVVDATGPDIDLAMRFWVPEREMEMAPDEHPDRAGSCWISGSVHLRSS